MKHLTDLKNPIDALNGVVTISQKIDGSAFILKRVNGELKFFGRESKKEIDHIQRTIMNLYEPAIEYLLKQDFSFLPNNGEIHFEYFPPTIKPLIPVKIKPKNNLVLLFTTKGDAETIAKKIGVEAPPVIFKGKLSEDQKEMLASGGFNISQLHRLNPHFRVLINPDTMEGIVVTTANGETFKVTDPNFTNQIKDKKATKAVDKEFEEYTTALLKLVVDFDFEVPEGYKFTPQNYINVVLKNVERQKSKIFTHKELFAEFGYGKPFTVDFVDINWSMIPSTLAPDMKANPWFKDFVRLLIANHSKIKAKATKQFSREIIAKLNKKMEPLLKESTRFSAFALSIMLQGEK